VRHSAFMLDRLLEEGLCCRHIASAAEPESTVCPTLSTAR
jgi:hypothetical protein